jgi:hypothetical protein
MKAGTLRPFYAAFGGCASVYLDTDRHAEAATQALDLRWRTAREELADAGARGETLDAIAEVLADATQAAPGRAVFARDGMVIGIHPLRAAPAQPIARLAPLPRLLPALADDLPAMPHLRIAVRLDGGEVLTCFGPDLRTRFPAAGPDGRPGAPGATLLDHGEAQSTGEITAEAWPVHKTSVGGWSQANNQCGTEHAWQENAKEVAAQVSRQAHRAAAEFIVVSGDVRARGLLLDQLASDLRDRAVIVDAEVAADSAELAGAAAATTARMASEACQRGLDQWRAMTARRKAASGIRETVAALRAGQAAAVFVGRDPALAADCWLGVDGTEFAVTKAELAEFGVIAPLADRTDEAIIRAAASTDVELFVIPDDLLAPGDAPPDGVCATLRYPPPQAS